APAAGPDVEPHLRREERGHQPGEHRHQHLQPHSRAEVREDVDDMLRCGEVRERRHPAERDAGQPNERAPLADASMGFEAASQRHDGERAYRDADQNRVDQKRPFNCHGGHALLVGLAATASLDSMPTCGCRKITLGCVPALSSSFTARSSFAARYCEISLFGSSMSPKKRAPPMQCCTHAGSLPASTRWAHSVHLVISWFSTSKLRASYGQAQVQYRHRVHWSWFTSTMPSSRW